MPAAYSYDLRERVVAVVAEGASRRRAARQFKVGISTVIRWVARLAATGSCAATPSGRNVVPSPVALERLCADLRHGARREAHRRLTNALSAEQRKRLDALTERRDESGLSWLTWLPAA